MSQTIDGVIKDLKSARWAGAPHLVDGLETWIKTGIVQGTEDCAAISTAFKSHFQVHAKELQKNSTLIPLQEWTTMGHIPHVTLTEQAYKTISIGIASSIIIAKKTHFFLCPEFLANLRSTKKYRSTMADYADRSPCYAWGFGAFSPSEEERIEAIISNSSNLDGEVCPDPRSMYAAHNLMVEFAAVCAFTLSAGFDKAYSVYQAELIAREVRALFKPVAYNSETQTYGTRATAVNGEVRANEIRLSDFGNLVVHPKPYAAPPAKHARAESRPSKARDTRHRAPARSSWYATHKEPATQGKLSILAAPKGANTGPHQTHRRIAGPKKN